MLPLLNGKSFLECNEEDLQVIIGNSDYAESEYIDYKEALSFLVKSRSGEDAKRKEQEKEHFRDDVCAFANSYGGYIVIGIKDNGNVATEIVGVELPGTSESYMNSIKDCLAKIQPKIPNYQIKQIKLKTGRYVFIIYIPHDSFSPYLHFTESHNCRLMKRIGPSNAELQYPEIKNMFMQQPLMEKELRNFCKERIRFYCDESVPNTNGRYVLLHIIPETFLDSSYNKQMYLIQKKGARRFSEIFNANATFESPQPTVDGIKFIQPRGKIVARLFNNGVAELYIPLEEYFYVSDNELYTESLEDYFSKVIDGYIYRMKNFLHAKKLFVSISFANCKGLLSQTGINGTSSEIDTNELIFEPVVFENITDEEETEKNKRTFRLNYYLSLGATANEKVNDLLKLIEIE